ncbi:hypothetical protein JCM19039_2628 [Geomicrobium sp. JCM 19039]|nr:hypothetical protein JCM19039_2628 [Geomicrobium sp. JCM 19039]
MTETPLLLGILSLLYRSFVFKINSKEIGLVPNVIRLYNRSNEFSGGIEMPRKRIFQKVIIYTMIFVLVVGTFFAGAASFM